MSAQDLTYSRNHPLLGVQIGKYRIIEVIGGGGMGIIFKARQESVDRNVALKLLPPDLACDEINIRRLEREAKALARLNHPNIVTTFDLSVTPDGQPYIVMEYVSGQCLRDVLDNEQYLPTRRALRMFVQIADAIRFAHRQGIIHRDLKPHNLMVCQEPSPDFIKVLDFGIARLAQESQMLTQTGEVIGSPLYMAPEQCIGAEVDQRTDVYSFGVLMFQCLAGEVPFRGESFMETVEKKVTLPIPCFRDLVPGAEIPYRLEEIVRHCMAVEPPDRFQTMDDVKDALDQVVQSFVISNQGQLAPPPPPAAVYTNGILPAPGPLYAVPTASPYPVGSSMTGGQSLSGLANANQPMPGMQAGMPPLPYSTGPSGVYPQNQYQAALNQSGFLPAPPPGSANPNAAGQPGIYPGAPVGFQGGQPGAYSGSASGRCLNGDERRFQWNNSPLMVAIAISLLFCLGSLGFAVAFGFEWLNNFIKHHNSSGATVIHSSTDKANGGNTANNTNGGSKDQASERESKSALKNDGDTANNTTNNQVNRAHDSNTAVGETKQGMQSKPSNFSGKSSIDHIVRTQRTAPPHAHKLHHQSGTAPHMVSGSGRRQSSVSSPSSPGQSVWVDQARSSHSSRPSDVWADYQRRFPKP